MFRLKRSANVVSAEGTIATTRFLLFAKARKQIVRELLLSSVELTSAGQTTAATCVGISRCKRVDDEAFLPEKGRIDFGINTALRTFHLHDIFLSPEFGLLIEIEKEAGAFVFSSNDPSWDETNLVIIDAQTGKSAKPGAYMRSEVVE